MKLHHKRSNSLWCQQITDRENQRNVVSCRKLARFAESEESKEISKVSSFWVRSSLSYEAPSNQLPVLSVPAFITKVLKRSFFRDLRVISGTMKPGFVSPVILISASKVDEFSSLLRSLNSLVRKASPPLKDWAKIPEP